FGLAVSPEGPRGTKLRHYPAMHSKSLATRCKLLGSFAMLSALLRKKLNQADESIPKRYGNSSQSSGMVWRHRHLFVRSALEGSNCFRNARARRCLWKRPESRLSVEKRLRSFWDRRIERGRGPNSATGDPVGSSPTFK